MRVDVIKMVEAAEGVSTFFELGYFLFDKGLRISERTLYRWHNGRGFDKDNVKAAAKLLNLEMKDVIIFE